MPHRASPGAVCPVPRLFITTATVGQADAEHATGATRRRWRVQGLAGVIMLVRLFAAD